MGFPGNCTPSGSCRRLRHQPQDVRRTFWSDLNHALTISRSLGLSQSCGRDTAANAPGLVAVVPHPLEKSWRADNAHTSGHLARFYTRGGSSGQTPRVPYWLWSGSTTPVIRACWAGKNHSRSQTTIRRCAVASRTLSTKVSSHHLDHGTIS